MPGPDLGGDVVYNLYAPRLRLPGKPQVKTGIVYEDNDLRFHDIHELFHVPHCLPDKGKLVYHLKDPDYGHLSDVMRYIDSCLFHHVPAHAKEADIWVKCKEFTDKVRTVEVTGGLSSYDQKVFSSRF